VTTADNGHAAAPTKAEPAVLRVPLNRVRPMPDQPREHFDKRALEELAASIEAVGQLQPAPVARVKGDPRHDFELIDGQRRWHACAMAGLDTLLVMVVDEPDPEKRFALSVVANFARQGHHPMEIARACRRMRTMMTVDQVAAALGKGPAYVHQHLSLLKLHPDLQDAMHPSLPKGDRLPVAAALRLAPLPPHGPGGQLAAWSAMRASGVSMMRAAEAAVAGLPQTEGRGRVKGPYDQLRTLLERLERFTRDLEAVAPSRARELASRPGKDAPRLAGKLRHLIRVASERLEAVEGHGGAA
jgi:ParB/RepB/Spo0J family partition protein